MVESQRPLVTVAAVALRNGQGDVLLAQRPEGKNMAGLWEFPGGKLEAFETPEACLIRELQEELGINVLQAQLEPIQFVSYAYEKFHLLMLLYGCQQWQGEIRLLEHSAMAWAQADALETYPMPPADEPLILPLRDWLARCE